MTTATVRPLSCWFWFDHKQYSISWRNPDGWVINGGFPLAQYPEDMRDWAIHKAVEAGVQT